MIFNLKLFRSESIDHAFLSDFLLSTPKFIFFHDKTDERIENWNLKSKYNPSESDLVAYVYVPKGAEISVISYSSYIIFEVADIDKLSHNILERYAEYICLKLNKINFTSRVISTVVQM